jgi:hypothetical protein
MWHGIVIGLFIGATLGWFFRGLFLNSDTGDDSGHVVIREGSVKKNLNERPTTERPSAPKSQTSPILSDIGYRVKLIQHGVHSEYVNTEVGHRLDYIGNLVGCYRTSMEEQDPSRYAIEKFAAQHRKAT